MLSIEGREKGIETRSASLGPSPASLEALVPAQRLACQPWCVEHEHAEGVCTGPTVATPGGRWGIPGHISMSHGPAGGTLFMLAHDPDAELTTDEFEQLCLIGLAQVSLARGKNRSGGQA
ncbi:hypothetical protein ACQP2T_13560 [Nonomuraea sp. CA-143628]|uniref:hypothetical protein n=1 Tax=Nonomuraea sp. CA-143628 TaxID=3239997 RepID=UPI003D8BDEBC